MQRAREEDNKMQKVKELFYKGIFDNKTEKEIYKLARGIEKQEIHTTIAEMLQMGDLQYSAGGKLRVPYLEGKLQGNRRGFAFFIPEKGGQDLFIKQENLAGAIHGDQVLVKKIGGKKGDEACVVKVVRRNTNRIVGQYHYSKYGGRVTPDDSAYAQDILIEENAKAAIEGEKVVVKITKQFENGNLMGSIERVLGFGGELEVEENALLAQSELPQEFSNSCLAYADKVASQKIEAEGRLDLRNTLCITIDGDDSRDYDDAISITKEEDGYLLGVHIADVSHYVKRGDILDIEAYERGTSVYFPDRVLPMLPEQLSNGACSLNAGEDKYTLSCIMHIDNKGTVTKYKIANSIICSKYRMTYKQVSKIVAGDMALCKQYAEILPLCTDFANLTKLLIANRKNRGSIDLDIEESQITVQDGKIEIVKYERTFAHRMIEEAMILANETVAKFVEEKGHPFVYRVHEKPATEKASNFTTFLHSLGIAANFDIEAVKPQDYAKVIENLQEENMQTIVHKIMLRSMSKARYSHSNCGHFGLASTSYAHFTSPIRRYPDLLIHRIIKHILNGEFEEVKTFKTFVEKASMQCSLRERRAEECERNVDELYKVFYMQEFIGQNFIGKVSGVTNFALFVELENGIEGHIKIENLPEDSYTFIEEKFVLKGHKQSYSIGDSVEVTLMRCDIGARKIEFLPLGVSFDKDLSKERVRKQNSMHISTKKRTGERKDKKGNTSYTRRANAKQTRYDENGRQKGGKENRKNTSTKGQQEKGKVKKSFSKFVRKAGSGYGHSAKRGK